MISKCIGGLSYNRYAAYAIQRLFDNDDICSQPSMIFLFNARSKYHLEFTNTRIFPTMVCRIRGIS